jgi:hypothetical protein
MNEETEGWLVYVVMAVAVAVVLVDLFIWRP